MGASQVRCPICGKEDVLGTANCLRCGHALVGAERTPQSSVVAGKRSAPIPRRFMGGRVALWLAIAGVTMMGVMTLITPVGGWPRTSTEVSSPPAWVSALLGWGSILLLLASLAVGIVAVARRQRNSGAAVLAIVVSLCVIAMLIALFVTGSRGN